MAFCPACSKLTRELRYDPAAEFFVDVMSGACIWQDETHAGWCFECHGTMRFMFNLRYCMTVGEPVDPNYAQRRMQLWQQLEREYPDWPLFRPERRSPEIAPEIRRQVERTTRRFCVDARRQDRKLNRQAAEDAEK